VALVVAFSKGREAATAGKILEPHELRAQARTLIDELSIAVPAEVLADDMAKELALRDLLGDPLW
jgi:hypothetical protein